MATNNLARGELGLFPHQNIIDIRSVEFYKHLSNSENKILKETFRIDKDLRLEGVNTTLNGHIRAIKKNTADMFLVSWIKKEIKTIIQGNYKKI